MAYLFLAVALVLVPLTVFWQRSLGRPMCPPGPRKHWLYGNLFDMPYSVNWQRLLDWKQQFGDMVYLTAFGHSVIVLNTPKAIKDLLVKRARNYSNRPHTVMAYELYDMKKSMVLADYDDKYRELRKLTQQAFGPEASKKYEGVQLDIIRRFLQSLQKDPQGFRTHTRLLVSRFILAVTYGLDAETADSEFIAGAELTLQVLTKATLPGAYLVDLLPSLKHLPTWFPFASFHEVGARGRKLVYDHRSRPFEYVRQQMADGVASPSFVSDLLSDSYMSKFQSVDAAQWAEYIKWAAGDMFGAGVETSFSTTLILFLAMALHPGAQAKAQAEIDLVTGGHKLVTLSDRPNMPYFKALLQEVARWQVVVPTGVFRRSDNDDVYNGYYIPANTIVLPSIWALSQSVEDPGRFNPERFLDDSNSPNPYEYIYGFGKRICPGRYLADNFIFLVTANILAFFNVSQPSGPLDDGLKLPSNVSFTPTMVSCPEPFACNIRPRTSEHAEEIAAMIA